MISRASPEDAARAVELLRRAAEERVVTPAAVRHNMANARPEDQLAYWKAEVDGQLVGWASGGLDAFAPVRTVAFGVVVVDPGHRRAGIGSALWAGVAAHLERAGARRIVAFSQAGPGSKEFAVAQRFRLEGTHTTLALDPHLLPPAPVQPGGVEIVPLARFEHEPERIYEADRESSQDEPGPSDFSGMTFDTWRRYTWEHPDCDHEVSTAAVTEGQVVGTSFVYTDRESGRAANAGTGVMRAYRGRGLGLLLKQHSLAAAAAAGITRVITQNDETNAPMLAINAKLGYEPFATGHAWVLEW